MSRFFKPRDIYANNSKVDSTRVTKDPDGLVTIVQVDKDGNELQRMSALSGIQLINFFCEIIRNLLGYK